MSTSPTPLPSSMPSELQPLEPGDRLTRAEFERRYDAMPHVKKAERIEGVVYMPSPVRINRHGSPHFRLIGLLAAFASTSSGASSIGSSIGSYSRVTDFNRWPRTRMGSCEAWSFPVYGWMRQH